MNHFKNWDVGDLCLVCFIIGLIYAAFLVSGVKSDSEVCEERGGLYINSNCIKVDKIDLREDQ